jgi:CheY-like chemotaxis protein
MLNQALILASNREYAQAMRAGLLRLGNEKTQVDLELDALRAMQLVPQNYELIIIDMLLNAMDGLQLLLLLKHQAPAGKFVIVSDTNDEILRAHAYQNGADLVLLRPRSPQAFQSAVEAIDLLLQSTDPGALAAEAADEPPVPIVDLVQTHCLSGDSVLLQVRGARLSGDIFIYRGEVFHAQYPGRSGEGAFYEIAQWDGGLARIKALPIHHLPPRTIEVPYRELLGRVRGADDLPASLRPSSGRLFMVSSEMPLDVPATVPEAVREAPPLEEAEEVSSRPMEFIGPHDVAADGGTPLPTLNAHWKVNLMGELVEGSQVSELDRCAFITYFIYRKLADIAVALEVDYFNEMTLWGPHLQQVLVADNLGVRHAVFETPRTDESERDQYVNWCREQSL